MASKAATVKAERLRDEIALREASIRDAQREHAQGELATAEWEALEQRERATIATLQATLDEAPSLPKVTRRRRPRLLVVGLSCLALAAVGLVWINVSLRQAGTSQTGGVNLSGKQEIQQLLVEGEGDIARGNVAAALVAYQRVLTLSPTNVAALTEVGWLDFSAGSAARNAVIVSRAIAQLRSAVDLAPRDPAPRLYYAIVAMSIPTNRALAKREFAIFLRLHPTAAQRAVAQPYTAALGLSH